ncbi:hypothetical protein HVA01_02380 [Halovibrio variabilis]|uniref:Uncharacterized protein n=1 Tax=Halovibrio variabilis TaxID=31910 RepID=A0A511UN64_9GAMM|nr:hypothetical protein HVA01_02380 [Halovibrio variabilis]
MQHIDQLSRFNGGDECFMVTRINRIFDDITLGKHASAAYRGRTMVGNGNAGIESSGTKAGSKKFEFHWASPGCH